MVTLQREYQKSAWHDIRFGSRYLRMCMMTIQRPSYRKPDAIVWAQNNLGGRDRTIERVNVAQTVQDVFQVLADVLV